MIPKLKHGACGRSLRVSVLILGWIQTLGCACVLIFMIIKKSSYISITGYDDKNSTNELKMKNLTEEEKHIHVVVSNWIYGAVMVCLVGSILVSALLLCGTYMQKHQLLIPYIYFVGINVCINLLFGLVSFIYMFSDQVAIGPVIRNFLSTGIAIYWWLLVYSYYIEMKEDKLQFIARRDPLNNRKPNQIENPFSAVYG